MIDDILTFIEFTNLFRSVERVIRIPGSADRWENDAEHSYQLAMCAWWIIERDKLELDLGLAISYCLVHDLVEAYAGDTFFYAHDSIRSGKEEREGQAADRIRREFPQLENLHRRIAEYEALETSESRFVYALDKMMPLFMVYLDGGRIWREKGITFSQVLESKRRKIAVSPDIIPYFDQMISLLEHHRIRIFGEEPTP